MKPDFGTFIYRWLMLGFTILISLDPSLLTSNLAQARQSADSDDPAQVMTRGPVHEAFAAPLNHDPKPGPVVTIEPPKTVEELPPDQKPVGASIQWIPGYWQWDEGRNDFLWISGIWRDPPPGRQWVPGYWHQVATGFQWVPGAWTPVPEPQANTASAAGGAVGSAQSQYLPAPPPTLEAGPNTPTPSGQVFWSPGCWTWQGLRFVWRPGFWAAVQPGWVWMPAQFSWTPNGYLYVPGYWDLQIVSRGLLFAPVYYPQPVYLQPGYVLTPSVTIMSSAFTTNLFVQPAYSHYCFGDYYAQSYLSIGIFPWFSMSFASGPAMPRYYDPLFTYYSVVNIRNDPRWITRVHEQYIVRRDNIAMRPPRSLIEQTRMMRSEEGRGGRERVQVMARPVGELARHPGETHGLQLERLDAASRRHWQNQAMEVNRYREQRALQEREGAREFAAAREKGESHFSAKPMNLSHSPVSSRPVASHSSSASHTTSNGHPGERVAHLGEDRAEAHRQSSTGASKYSEYSEGRKPESLPAGHSTRLAEESRSDHSRDMEQTRTRGGEHPASSGHYSARSAQERRPPPHPTPVPHERREGPRG